MAGAVVEGQDIVKETLAQAYYSLAEVEKLPPLRDGEHLDQTYSTFLRRLHPSQLLRSHAARPPRGRPMAWLPTIPRETECHLLLTGSRSSSMAPTFMQQPRRSISISTTTACSRHSRA